MSNVFTVAGATFSVGSAAPTTYDKAGFEAVDWDEIGEVSDIPQFGRQYNPVTFNPVGSRGTVKRKGSYNDGSLTITYGVDEDDDGQAAIEALVDSDDDQAFRVVLQTGRHIYFTGQVMSNPITLGTVDNIVTKQVQIEVTGKALFEDAPTGG